MDKDWAEKEAMRVSAEATGVFSLSVSDEPWLRETITNLLRKVRRDTIESCAVIAEAAEPDYLGNPKIGFPSLKQDVRLTLQKVAQAIRESEGKV